MAVTVKPTGTVYLRLFSKLEAEDPTAFDHPASQRPDGLQNAHLRPGVAYFAGRVVGFTTRAFQTAPDVWVDDRIVVVALADGETEEVNLGPVDKEADFEVDGTPEVVSKVQTYAGVVAKLTAAVEVAEHLVAHAKPVLKKGKKALAVKGRKVAIGTEVEVFWAGTKWNKFTQSYDERLGVVLPNGAKEWVSAGNFEPIPTPAEIANYGRALKDLEQAKKALENPLGHRQPVAIPQQDDNYEEAKLANDEAAEDLRRAAGRLSHAELLALMPPRVLVREMVRDVFGDEAVAEREEVVQGEHERHHEAERQQEVQMEEG